MLSLDEKYFSDNFYKSLIEKLEIEGKSIFAYFPSFYSAEELTSVIKYAINNTSEKVLCNQSLVASVFQAHIFSQLSLQSHLVDRLKQKSNFFSEHWLEYAILAGDYFAGRYINAFLENDCLDELKIWVKGIADLNQQLATCKMNEDEQYKLITCTLFNNAITLLGFEKKLFKLEIDKERATFLSRSEELVMFMKRLII